MPSIQMINDTGHNNDKTRELWEIVADQTRTTRDNHIKQWGLEVPHDLANGQTNVKKVPIECGLLTAEQIEITETTPTLLLKKLSTGHWSAEQVLRAFISRAVIAHHLTNPLADVFFDRAIQRAQELDRAFQITGAPVGPLHGLPISIKDIFRLSGTESTVGLVSAVGRKDCNTDQMLLKLVAVGAVLYCKTNVPQSLMSGECVNFIYGRTSSPLNNTLSAGGSSGGEGSLIALGGSPLGIGSDIAGSIRTPANFNGIYGLCPSPERFPYHSVEYNDGLKGIRPVAGPLARGVDGLEVFTRNLLAMKPWEWDAGCLNLPWREEEYEAGLGRHHKLSFAFMRHDQVVLPHPPILRGMQELRTALERAGHHVIDIENFNGKEILETSEALWMATGGEELSESLARFDEPLIKEALVPDLSKRLSVRQYRQRIAEVERQKQKYHDIWQSTRSLTESGLPVDAIILPSGGHVAPPHGTMEYYTYEAISNLLEWTCATIPVTKVDPEIDVKSSKDYRPMSEYDKRNWQRYEPSTYKDAAVCLQVMGQRFTEEKVLGLLKTIDRALGRDEYYMA